MTSKSATASLSLTWSRREVGLRTIASSLWKSSCSSTSFFPGAGGCGVVCTANRSAASSRRTSFPSVPTATTTSPTPGPRAASRRTSATRGTASPPSHREGPWPTNSGPRCRRRRRRRSPRFGAPISSHPYSLQTIFQRGKLRSQARRCQSACRIESHDAGRLNSARWALTA